MSGIPLLPVELLSRIFESITHLPTLQNATLCSRQFQAIVTPYLYRSFEIKTTGEWDQKMGWERNINVKDITVLFLRNPNLAKHVRHFSIRPAIYDDPHGGPSPWTSDEEADEDEDEEEENDEGPDDEEQDGGQDGDVDNSDQEDGDESKNVGNHDDEESNVSSGEELDEEAICEEEHGDDDMLKDSQNQKIGNLTLLAPLREEPPPREEVPHEIKEAIREASHNIPEQISWLVKASTEDALLALLLPRFTNLETLDLEVELPDFIPMMLGRVGRGERPFDKRPAFIHVHSIVWAHNDEKYGGPVKGEFFLLPALRSAFMHRLGSAAEGVSDSLAKIPHSSSGITHVEMKDCLLNDGDIQNLLSIPKALKTFIYEAGWGWISESALKPSMIRLGLEKQKDCLENLWLDLPHDGFGWDDFDDEALNGMTSLREFKRLRRLRIAPEYVYGGLYEAENDRENTETLLLEFLPPNLESLQLTHCADFGSEICSTVQHILFHRETRLPALQSVTLEMSPKFIVMDKAKTGKRLMALSQLAENRGVQMTILNNDGSGQDGHFKRVERKWGMDEDIEWAECSSECNTRPPYPPIGLLQAMEAREELEKGCGGNSIMPAEP